jgi:hypothetical protein
MYEAPTEALMYAFSYTVRATRTGSRGSFITSGGGERLGTGRTMQERIIRYNDTSPEGLREKVEAVLGEMERRLSALGFSWADAVTTQAYTVQNIGHLVGEAITARGGCAGGLVWTYARPPVVGLEFEMDVRGAAREIVL